MRAMEFFEFTDENKEKCRIILERYPKEKNESALLPFLHLAQEQCGGWLPKTALEKVSRLLFIPLAKVYEVATFYTMFHLKPVGKFNIQICRSLSCWLKGAEDIKEACKRYLNIDVGETTPDGLFTLTEVECLGACTQAPVIQINDENHENLCVKKTLKILKELAHRQ